MKYKDSPGSVLPLLIIIDTFLFYVGYNGFRGTIYFLNLTLSYIQDICKWGIFSYERLTFDPVTSGT